METKFCPSCQTNKPIDQYHRNRHKADGLATECKVCKRLAENRRYQENSAEILAAAKKKREPFLVPVIIRQPVRRDDGAFDLPLTKGKSVILDEADLPLVAGYNWSAQKGRNTYYAVRNDKGYQVRMHKLLLGVEPHVIVDHLDGNGLNNRRANLRVATHSQNLQNANPIGAIPYRGVHADKTRSGITVYRALIHFAKKRTSIGRYPTPEDAARAYDREALRLYGEHARLNFPAQGTAHEPR